jgi:hypothetical protein
MPRFSPVWVRKTRRGKPRIQRRKLELGCLEERLVPSRIVWLNRDDPNLPAAFPSSSYFTAAQAAAATQLVDIAIADWEYVVQNFNYTDTTHPTEFQLQIYTKDLGQPGYTDYFQIDKDGKPWGATTNLNWNLQDYWYLPTTNGFSPGSTEYDFYTTVHHEIGHALGIVQDVMGLYTTPFAIQKFVTPITSGPNAGKYNFLAPSSSTVRV